MTDNQQPAPSQRMDAQAARLSSYEAATAREIADRWVDQLVATADKRPSIGSYGKRTVTAVRYVLAGGGPGADITFVFDAHGDLEYAVLDYYEGGPRAFRVLDDPDVDKLYAALNNDAEDNDDTEVRLTREQIRDTYDSELPTEMGDGPFVIYPTIDDGRPRDDEADPLCTVARAGAYVYCLTCGARGPLDGYEPTHADIERWHTEL